MKASRARELATLDRLTLADIIELTGFAPAHSGQFGALFVAHESGIRFELKESTLRLRPAKEQVEARRLIEEGRLILPCAPSDTINFNVRWNGDFPLPAAFVRAVQARQVEQLFDRWRDQIIDGLKAAGLANTPLNFHAFTSLTTFGDSHLSGDSYAPRKDEFGNVLSIEAGKRYQCDEPWLSDEELKTYAEHRENARLEFPTTAEQLVRWIRNQGGDVELEADDIKELTRSLVDLGATPDTAAGALQPDDVCGNRVSAAEAGRRGADGRHAANRKRKQKAIAMYQVGDYPTKDRAAEAISERLGGSFGTARNWLKGVERHK